LNILHFGLGAILLPRQGAGEWDRPVRYKTVIAAVLSKVTGNSFSEPMVTVLMTNIWHTTTPSFIKVATTFQPTVPLESFAPPLPDISTITAADWLAVSEAVQEYLVRVEWFYGRAQEWTALATLEFWNLLQPPQSWQTMSDLFARAVDELNRAETIAIDLKTWHPARAADLDTLIAYYRERRAYISQARDITRQRAQGIIGV
jgi:hypothetical protein